MNAPFRDLLASTEVDERMVIIDLVRLFSNHALYNLIQNPTDSNFCREIFRRYLETKVDFGFSVQYNSEYCCLL